MFRHSRPSLLSSDQRRAAGQGRRQFLQVASSLSLATLWQTASQAATQSRPVFRDYPFSLGVASGDPTPDGVVLWTRLAPDPLHGGGLGEQSIEVRWQISEDERMKKIVQSGSQVASPALGHSVHVEVAGLKPARQYFYRFQAGNELSPIGKTRTAPALDASPDRLRFAFASCQHFESGYFNAYYHMAGDDLDLVIHLGDYIYEGAAATGAIRKHVGLEIHSLDDYRNRHAQYKTDIDLQAAHAAFPWLVTWDDHEFDNNCASDISELPDVNPADFLVRRAAAYQAYYEHMPLRTSSVPHGPFMQLYRACQWGQLAHFAVLDTRQYRSDQPCGDRNTEPCEAAFSESATMLGEAQETWLTEQLKQSPAKWNVLAQQVMMARVDLQPGPGLKCSMDQWPGYEIPRRRLLKSFQDLSVSNPIVLTGDIHSNWANELPLDPEASDSPIVANEFVCTSLSSGGNGNQNLEHQAAMKAENPFVKFHNAERGYVRCEVTNSSWRSDYQVVPVVTRRGSPLVTRASFHIEDGQTGMDQV